jgi:purine nucleosidase
MLTNAQRTSMPPINDASSARFTGTNRVIVDTDPGNDDALALLMLMTAPALSVEAVTIAPGNVGFEKAVKNALYVVNLADRGELIPVHAGARETILRRPFPSASFIHGESGLGAFETPSVQLEVHSEHASDAIRRIVRKYPGEIVIVALGAPTNIAIALLREPEIARLVKGIQFVGGPMLGAIPGFNSLVDPEATSILLTSGAPLSMFGGSTYLTDSILYQSDFDAISNLRTRFSKFFVETNTLRLEYEVKARGAPGSINGDPLAAALVIDPTIGLEYLPVAMKIELVGELTRGTLLYGDNRYNGEPTPLPNVNLCVRADNDKFRSLVMRTLAHC